MYENEVKNKSLLKFLKTQTNEWSHKHKWESNPGHLFMIYHDIMMLRGDGFYMAICKKYWNTFFETHIVPEFIIVANDVFEIDYRATANKILDICVKDLSHQLSS